METNTDYASYLLRLRKVQSGTRETWVALMQSTGTGERRSFPSVEALAAFLLSQYNNYLPENRGLEGEGDSAVEGK